MSACFLYRHFDGKDRLLYVGVSLNVIKRSIQHRSYTHWYSKIRRMEMKPFKTREEALAAEQEAILRENPLYNLQHPSPEEQEEEETVSRMEASRTNLFEMLDVGDDKKSNSQNRGPRTENRADDPNFCRRRDSAEGRRYRDLVFAYVNDLGGLKRIPETMMGVLRELARIRVKAEQLGADGEEVDVSEMCTLSSTILRLSLRLGFNRVEGRLPMTGGHFPRTARPHCPQSACRNKFEEFGGDAWAI